MAFKSICLTIFFSLIHFILVSAEEKPCGDHNVKTNYFRNCAEPSPKSQSVQFHNMTFTLTDDCRLKPRGCFTVKKKISKAKVDYTVTHPPFNRKGTEDFCEQLESPDTQKKIQNYKIPRKCTIQPGDYCITKGSTEIEQLNSRTLNLLNGQTTGKIILDHEDSQDKSCFEFKFTVSKK